MWGTIFGGLALLAAIVFGIVAWRQAVRRRPQIALFMECERIKPSIPSVDMGLSFMGAPVSDPYWVRFGIRNEGSSDLRSEMFDGGRAIALEITCDKLVTLLHGDTFGSWISYIDESGASTSMEFTFGPELLRVGESVPFALIVSGAPRWKWQHFLPDLKVDLTTSDATVRARVDKISPRSATVISVAAAAIAVVAFMIQFIGS